MWKSFYGYFHLHYSKIKVTLQNKRRQLLKDAREPKHEGSKICLMKFTISPLCLTSKATGWCWRHWYQRQYQLCAIVIFHNNTTSNRHLPQRKSVQKCWSNKKQNRTSGNSVVTSLKYCLNKTLRRYLDLRKVITYSCVDIYKLFTYLQIRLHLS